MKGEGRDGMITIARVFVESVFLRLYDVRTYGDRHPSYVYGGQRVMARGTFDDGTEATFELTLTKTEQQELQAWCERVNARMASSGTPQ